MKKIHFPKPLANDTKRRGQLASQKVVFGKLNRYAVAPVHTRFDRLAWFVWDAEVPDSLEYDPVMGFAPSIIRQAESLEDALAGLI